MKRWIIATVIAGLMVGLYNEWRKHEAASPAYNQEIGRQVTLVHQQHPDWTREEIANEVARNASNGAMGWGLAIPLITWFLVALLKPHWWYLVVAFVLFLAGAFWIVTL
jgi:hypothetical protein